MVRKSMHMVTADNKDDGKGSISIQYILVGKEALR
jgi:hypothetical protein